MMECEHEGCKEEATIIICDTHINEDYPSLYEEVLKELEVHLTEENQWGGDGDNMFSIHQHLQELKAKYGIE